MVKKKKIKRVLKTFNLDPENYEKFSSHCKDEGISMSRRVDNFIRTELERLGLHLEVEKDVSDFSKGSETEISFKREHSFKKFC